MTEHGDPVSAVTAPEATRILTSVVERHAAPGLSEMIESAARSVVYQVFETLGRTGGHEPVLIVCGGGLTGAVGFGLGRHLANHGISVEVHCTRQVNHVERERHATTYRASAGALYVGPQALRERLSGGAKYSVIVDGLLGGGVRQSTDREVVQFLDLLADLPRRRDNPEASRVLALEIPSGLDPTTGVPGERVVTADTTISFGIPRTGMSATECGSIVVADVGIPPEAFHKEPVITYPCRFRGEFLLRLRTFT
jgi:hydroxyethylthiazole kinase-like uncharacterized protein yjeF